MLYMLGGGVTPHGTLFAQTYTAGQTGTLTGVLIRIAGCYYQAYDGGSTGCGEHNGAIFVRVTELDAAGNPDLTAVLASASLPGVSIPKTGSTYPPATSFALRAEQTAGHRYAVVMTATGTQAAYPFLMGYGWVGRRLDTYLRGRALVNAGRGWEPPFAGPGGDPTQSPVDFLFETDVKPAPSCADYILIDSRGSGGSGLSPPGREFRAELRRLLPGSVIRVVPNPYPAVDGFFTRLGALGKVGGRYHQSVVEGKTWLRNYIRQVVANSACHETRVFLTGYSQGAHVVGDVYQGSNGLGISERRRIVGVSLFGDPKFNSNDVAGRGNYRAGRNGVLGTRPKYPRDTIGRILSYCHRGDTICQGVSAASRSSHHSDYDTRGCPNACEPHVAAQRLVRNR